MKACPKCQRLWPYEYVFCPRDSTTLRDVKPNGGSRHSQDDELIGHVIEDRYRLERVIGRGGFGTVYSAAHERLPRNFAVKVLLKTRALEERHLLRFKQEVRAAAVLKHPNVLEVIDYNNDPVAGYFVVMPLLIGETLLDRIQKNRLQISEMTPIILQTASALQAAHDLGIVHRDIKPENIFLATSTTASEGFLVQLLDFGIAKVMLERSDPRLIGDEQPPIETLQAVGTCLTMSPEQVRGEDVDHRADIYGLGCVLFEVFTGELPYNSENNTEIMRMHVQEHVQRPSARQRESWIPEALDAFLMRMMAKRREDRPQSMRDVAQEWEAVRPVVEEAWADSHLVHLPVAKTAVRHERDQSAAPSVDSETHGDGDGRTLVDSPGLLSPSKLLRDSAVRSNTLESPMLRGRDGTEEMPYASVTPLPNTHKRELPLRPAHALVVDDDQAIRNLVRHVLQSAGWTCSTVDGGTSCLQWLADHPAPTAIILDMLMPNLDGLSVLKMAREQGFAGPVVICTTLQSQAVKAEAMGQNNVWFVTKGRELHMLPELLAGIGVGPVLPSATATLS